MLAGAGGEGDRARAGRCHAWNCCRKTLWGQKNMLGDTGHSSRLLSGPENEMVGLAWSGGDSWGSLQVVGVHLCSACFSCSSQALDE